MADTTTARLVQRCASRFPVRANVLGSAFTLVFLLTATAPARGSQIIDQSYLPFHPSSGLDQAYNLSFSGNQPLGQQFIPTLKSLDFVNLWIEDAGTNAGLGATIDVQIRAGSITGTILGSSTATVPAGTNTGGGTTLTDFTFSSPITLTPGSTYVIEATQVAPIVLFPTAQSNDNFAWVGGPLGGSTYPSGEAYVSGTLQPGFDFAFEEGTQTAPEPSTFVLVASGALVFMGCGLRRRRAVPSAAE